MVTSVLTMCGLLLTSPDAPPMLSDVDGDACLAFSLDFAGRLAATTPKAGFSPALQLARARTELGFQANEYFGARLAIDPVRSAPETGYLGVDGETLLVRVQIAEARATLPVAGLALSAGLVDDPWVIRENRAFGWRPLAATLSEVQGWMDRSDLGGTLTWTAPDRLATLSYSLTTGEGLKFRERNDGKNSTLVGVFRPLGLVVGDGDQMLELAVMYRDGTRGLQRARDHRLGFRVSGGYHELVRGGWTFLKATGVGGDPLRTPSGWSTWVSSQPWGPVAGLVRYDDLTEIPGTAQSHRRTLMAAAGVRVPDGLARGSHLMLGLRRDTAGAQATPIAGADGAAAVTTLIVQLGTLMQGSTSLALPN